jgi:glyoxylate carboligase
VVVVVLTQVALQVAVVQVAVEMQDRIIQLLLEALDLQTQVRVPVVVEVVLDNLTPMVVQVVQA